MFADWGAVLRSARQHLRRGAVSALPPQPGLWGWVRAALAFQPAHPVAVLDRDVTRPAFRHAIELLANSRYREAIAALSPVVHVDPRHGPAWAARAAAFRMIGENERAIRDASHAIELQPDLAWAYATRGALHRLEKNYEQALRDLNQAIRLDSDYEWCIAGRGETYRLMGMTDRALEDANRALELNPRNDWALMSRIASYLDAHQDDFAVAAFRAAVNTNPDGDWALAGPELTYRLMGKDLTRYLQELDEAS
ncbi:tetratricopeptide repeat protein [Streptomyces sp. NPDC002580]|uniref:tetratricopeptide repeat protein n=1 Tax=Streptomyces sp. NPDC002580 TaxID=3364653 RepID=UPI0036C688E8